MDESQLIEERKKKVKDFFTKNYNWVVYVVLAIIVYLSVRIRTANLDKLRDITTGTWTLGPDLDPFLFLRWAKDIVEHGSLYAVDTMRYVPLGYDTRGEMLFLSYSIAWFHNYLGWTFGSESVTHSAVIYPVFMFALTVIAFFFFTRKLFIDMIGIKRANIVALVASFFLTVIPALLPRTIAGIPEKESAGFLFLFLSLYLFLSAWKAKKLRNQVCLGILAGVSTACMALIWGGFTFIFVTIGLSVIIAFFCGQVNLGRICALASWLAVSGLVMNQFSSRYGFVNLATSITTGIAFFALFLFVVDYFVKREKITGKLEKVAKMPKEIWSFIIAALIILVLILVWQGPGFILSELGNVKSTLVTPIVDRLGVTVAENRQPYFDEWGSSFGPFLGKIPLFFTIFFIGAVFLFYESLKDFKKRERFVLAFAYLLFLICVVFSRYKSDSLMNGTSGMSLFVYALGFFVLAAAVFKYYYLEKSEGFKHIDYGAIIIFVFFFISLVSARGAVRLIMVLVPPASIIAAFFVVILTDKVLKEKEQTKKLIIGFFAVILILSTFYSGQQFYLQVNAEASAQAPSVYTQQWQKAMAWVRESTPKNAVFSHWWDYGYWVQSLGERATMVDGGNAIVYWNYLTGRYALTGRNNTEALDVLYSHNVTYFLIDSTDIGKYSAFSSIGSDLNYDRASYLQTFLKDEKQTMETKNNTLLIYSGGFVLDEDITYEQNGTKIFLPKNKAGLGAVVIEKDANGTIVKQPLGIFVYSGKQYSLPLRYAYETNLIDFVSGLDAGVFIYPELIVGDQGAKIDKDGALMFLSSKTVKSQLARLYLYNEENPNFVLAHSEDDYIVEQIKKQDSSFDGDCVYYGGFRGALKIWEIHYPVGMKVIPEYVQKNYPDIRLSRA